MERTVVVGGGAAGMMAAIQSAGTGQQVVLFEKNEKLGKKLFITGKGRCNITNACDVSDLFSNIVTNHKFLYSSFYGFSNQDTIAFFEALGVSTKVERGGRVFPVSDKSSDVIRGMERECRRLNVKIRLQKRVAGLSIRDGIIQGVILADGEIITADKVILATGGMSYPSTGSSGDGYRMVKRAGHTVTKLRPGLTGICIKENIPQKLQGLTLKNSAVKIQNTESKKTLFEGFGEVLFTHYGVSGPLILSASSQIGDCLTENNMVLHIDMKPALSQEQLKNKLIRDFEAAGGHSLKNTMIHMLPKSMVPVLLERSGLKLDQKANQITKEERQKIADNIKNFTLTLTGLRSWDEAIITRGGVQVDEINPQTMESKLVKGLYLAGEILDLDALTGGYNLQIAWSTGYAAGTAGIFG